MFAIEKLDVAGKKDAEKAAKEMINAQHKKMKFLGSGCYGSVYGAKDSDVVYKIGKVSSNKPYLSYIKVLAKQKKHNPYTPKVYGVRYIKDQRGMTVFVVAMEKLTALPRDMYDVASYFEGELEYGGNDDSKQDAEKVLGIVRKVPKQLNEAMSILRNAFDEAGGKWDANWDLHEGNFMMRGKQVVCTDPLS
jgi:hypothetical protein